ncbi:MAG: hypothetical protein KA144_04600 [Xanthomonadaceae bacterium]|nr:hypothetical protein [Xanthomonadaceae bacterium]
MKTVLSYSTIAAALATAIAAVVVGASSPQAAQVIVDSGYAESVYLDFAAASGQRANFQVRTVSSGSLQQLEGRSFGQIVGEPRYQLAFEETRNSRIVAPTIGAVFSVNRDELNAGVEGFDVVGYPVSQGVYRTLAVQVSAGGQTRSHRALEMCWKGQDHCVIYDPQIEFLDSVVNNYRIAKAEGYGPKIQEQLPTQTGEISTRAVCRLASNLNIIGRSLTWSARTVKYENIFGMTLVSKSLGGQQTGITCNSSCNPAMYGYSNSSSAYGNLGYGTDCGWKHATGTTGRSGKAVSEAKCTHTFTGTARADVTVKGSGTGVNLAWDTNGGVDGSGGALTDTCGYF